MAMRPGETPVPIPNTMVKARAADGTALETMWESRWLPDFKKERTGKAPGKSRGLSVMKGLKKEAGRTAGKLQDFDDRQTVSHVP